MNRDIVALSAEVQRRRQDRGLLLLLDYDGTLVEIAPRPDLAVPTPELLDVLGRLSARGDMAVLIVSGRPLKEVRAFLPVPGLNFVGSHGGEGWVGERQWAGAGPAGPAVAPASLAATISSRLSGFDGWRLEQKPLGVAVHYRQVPPDQEPKVAAALEAWVQELLQAEPWEVIWGHKVVEVLPEGVSKGAAILDIWTSAGFSHLFPVYLGDDTTDESAFQALKGIGLSVKVGPAGADTAADHFLAGPAAVLAFLASLAREETRQFPS